MKKLNSYYFIGLILLQFIPLKVYSLSFTISFTGSGAANAVGNVQVQNLTKGTSLIVPGGNVLNLYDGTTTSTDKINSSNEELLVYPNPVIEKATVSFFAKQNGSTQIQVVTIDGKMMVENTCNFQVGINSFQLGLPNGTYTLKIKGSGYFYAATIISKSTTTGMGNIILNGNTSFQKKIKTAVSSMLYSAGDRILYSGASGNYRTNVVDVPTSDKIINFNFVECKDADNNYYSVVQIGNQLWSAQNLNTTMYRNGDPIPNISDHDQWGLLSTGAYCNVNNDITQATVYGRHYNFYAVSDVRNLAPIGWHVATDAEWATLIGGLGNGKLAGAKLKETGNAHWVSPNDLSTNEVGFTALPGGYRWYDGDTFSSSIGMDCSWWTSTGTSSTTAVYRGLLLESTSNYTNVAMSNNYGMCIRLVHD